MMAEPHVTVVKLSYKSKFSAIKKCEGILLTGGEDVHPRFYNSPEYLPYCDHDNMDEKRDEFEWAVLTYAKEKHIPLLGICRGLQITNVFFGGSLIPDIPSFGKYDHAKWPDGKDRYHGIRIDVNSQFKEIAGTTAGDVNSAHHQAVDRIGTGLVACAFSDDGVVEAIERKSGTGESFLLLVQWHPERMNDQSSQLVREIKLRFLESAEH
jgi:putative glutamine amidotransferase